ncbi:MAG: noc [Bacilli bacterium]|nr:noc [Bacilli bacterium]
MPEVKEFGLKLKTYEGQLKSATKAAEKRSIENNINKYSSLAMNKKNELEEIAKNHLTKGEIKVNVQTDPNADVLGEILISDILLNPYQPRKIFNEEEINELAASMKKNGLIQAIVVRRTPEGLVLVAGERRMRAALKNGWESITAITKTMDEAQAATASIIENFQRVDNNPIEIAEAIAAMIERVGVTQQEAAKMIGVTQPKIAQLMSLTKLIDPIKDLIILEKMSQSVGRILGSLEEDIQQRMLNSLENMSAEKAQHFVNIYKGFLGIHDVPEVETDAIDIRIFKRLLKGNCIDLYLSAWVTLNQGLKTLQSNKIKSIYFPTHLFPQSQEVRGLLQKNKISEYYNHSKKPEFRLIENMEKTASEITLLILNELVPIKELNEGQTDIGELIEISTEERTKNVLENVATFRSGLLTKYESMKGTAWELSYGFLVEECQSFEDDETELEVIEETLEELLEMLVELNGAFADTERQKHLQILKEAYDLAKLNEIQYTGSEHEVLFHDSMEIIKGILTNHMQQESYVLGRSVTPLWLNIKDLVDMAKLKNESSNEGSPVFETPIVEVEVLNIKPEKSKTSRILQIMQEESSPTHEISVKCTRCQMFNPNGNSYRERCMSTSISYHSFKRFAVDGLDAFDCAEYTPKLEVIQRKKAAANLDLNVALFEILIYQDGYSRSYPDLSWMKREIPELRHSSCKPEEVIELFKQQDEPTRAYWIEAMYRKYQLAKIVHNGLEHPFYTSDGQHFMVNNNSMENDDKI